MLCPNTEAHPATPPLMEGPHFGHDYGELLDLWECGECRTQIRIFDPYRHPKPLPKRKESDV